MNLTFYFEGHISVIGVGPIYPNDLSRSMISSLREIVLKTPAGQIVIRIIETFRNNYISANVDVFRCV